MKVSNTMREMNRVIVYIDGFNLYYGLKSKGWKRYYWLDLQKLANNLLKPGQTLATTKYFTARILAKERGKQRRQFTYLEALGTLANFHIYYGHYLEKTITCFNCNNTWISHEEKMTDVCIGTELLTDAFKDRFDTALIVSGDSDLVPPVQALKNNFSEKRVIVAFPPNRKSWDLGKTANARFTIDKYKFRKSMFPDQVVKPDGYVLERPKEWMKNVGA